MTSTWMITEKPIIAISGCTAKAKKKAILICARLYNMLVWNLCAMVVGLLYV